MNLAAHALFEGGTVWTGGRTATVHDALAVTAGRVVALDDEARRWADSVPGVDRVDLAGGFLMPSFGDGHAHPMQAGLEDDGPRIRPCRSVAEIVAEVRRFADAHPAPSETDAWVVGASYDSSLAPEGLFDARWLDEAVPDRPVLLRAWDYHTAWCNTAALRAAGVDDRTVDPPLGEIPRRRDGSPVGTLREWGAVELVLAVAPVPDTDRRVSAVRRATQRYAGHGVTWVQDAWVDEDDVDGYLAAAREEALATRVNLALRADPRRWPDQLSRLQEARAAVQALDHPRLSAHTVKFFADGVIESQTADLLEPYVGQDEPRGMPIWSPEALAAAVRDVVRAGFQPHIHAIGDAAVRAGLDAVASAPGAARLRPVLAHVQLVDPIDIPRFSALGVVANAQPLWAQLDDVMVLLTVPRLGPERAARQYPLHSLLRSGAALSFGSDWPVTSPDPLRGLSVAVARMNAAGEPPGGWLPDERLRVDDALVAYTAGVAFQSFADQWAAPWGVIHPGASADLVLLDHDPRLAAAPDRPGSLDDITVMRTWLGGAPTYPL